MPSPTTAFRQHSFAADDAAGAVVGAVVNGAYTGLMSVDRAGGHLTAQPLLDGGSVVVSTFAGAAIATFGEAAIAFTKPVSIAGALTPNQTLTHAFGSATFRWNNVYTGGIDASGNATIGGLLTAAGYVVSGGSFGAGRIYSDAAHGLAQVGISGSARDWTLLNPAGQVVASIPTGTNQFSLGGSLNVSGNTSISGGATFLGQVTSFDYASTSGAILRRGRNDSSLQLFGGLTSGAGIILRGSTSTPANGIEIYEGAVVRARFDAGRFLVGTTAYGSAGVGGGRFTGATQFDGGIVMNPTGNVNVTGSVAVTNGLTFGTSLLTIDFANSRVGIGTTTPAVAFDVAATARVTGTFTCEGLVTVDNLRVNGNDVRITALPTSDPGLPGRLWRSGTSVQVSV